MTDLGAPDLRFKGESRRLKLCDAGQFQGNEVWRGDLGRKGKQDCSSIGKSRQEQRLG